MSHLLYMGKYDASGWIHSRPRAVKDVIGIHRRPLDLEDGLAGVDGEVVPNVSGDDAVKLEPVKYGRKHKTH